MDTLVSPSVRISGFTLLELLASIAVFIFLVLFVAQLTSEISSVTNSSKARLESDDQVRMVMDRIEQDVSKMVKRNDVDYDFSKPASSGNDQFFFYAETAGYSASGSSSPSDTSIIGYRINANSGSANYNKLERYAGALPWGNPSTEGLVFLTYAGGGGSCAPLTQTLLSSKPVVATTSTDVCFHVVGDGVFRIEFCYQLKDGTYSTEPILSTAPSDWTGGTFYTSAATAPSSSNGSANNYSIGSRWYDTSACRGYICQSTSEGNGSQAVWRFIGWQDVSAIVVTIATLDAANRVLLTNSGKDLSLVADKLSKIQNSDLQGSSPTLSAQKWLQYINSGGLLGVMPKKAAYAVQVHQRYFYLNVQ